MYLLLPPRPPTSTFTQTMLTLTMNMINTRPKPPTLTTPFLPILPLPPPNSHKQFNPPQKPISISALILPPSSSSSPSQPKMQPQQQQLYQPFRPPPSPLPPKFRSLDTPGRIDILTNRLGLWFEYAPLIPALIQDGFSPSTIEELTGIPGIEQNRLVVAAQVRDTLVQSQIDPDLLSFFDTGGAELLYEVRLLAAAQRVDAVRYVVENNFDAKRAQELARSMKDKPLRKGDEGWKSFDDNLPGDCLGFMYFRQAQEHKTASSVDAWRSALEKALEAVQSDTARTRILEELEGKKEEEVKEAVDDGVRVPVVRMQVGEVAESSVVVVLPVCRAEEREVGVEEAPWEYRGHGDFGVIVAEKGWSRWVVLPGWAPVADLRSGGVVVAFRNAKVLPWRAHKWNREEPILVVADRGMKEVMADDGFYLVVSGENGSSSEEGLRVEKGLTLKELGVNESLGTVVLVVRPPSEASDLQLNEDDWE